MRGGPRFLAGHDVQPGRIRRPRPGPSALLRPLHARTFFLEGQHPARSASTSPMGWRATSPRIARRTRRRSARPAASTCNCSASAPTGTSASTSRAPPSAPAPGSRRSRSRPSGITRASSPRRAEVPRHVITMGVGTILDARRCLVLAFGEAKAAAVAAMVEGPVTAERPGLGAAIPCRLHAARGRGRRRAIETRRLLPLGVRENKPPTGSAPMILAGAHLVLPDRILRAGHLRMRGRSDRGCLRQRRSRPAPERK